MNAEGGLILLLGLMIGAPVLLGLLWLLNRIAGRTIVPLWLPILALLVLPVLGSVALDVAGEVRSLKVLDKHERIDYGNNFYRTGSWSRRFRVDVEAPWAKESWSPNLSLSADAATFDRLRVGQMVDVRIFELGSLFKFGRLANRSSWSMVSGWFFTPTPQGPWREGTATVEQISQFTEQRYRRRSKSRSPLPWPYEIVRLRFTPPGRAEPVEAMDNIEIAGAPNLVEKSAVKITWPEDDPRQARIVGGRPGAPWANTFYVWGQTLLWIAALLGLIALTILFRRRRKRRAQAG